MLQAIHLNIPGGPLDGNCLPCSGITGRAIGISSSSRSDYSVISQVKVISQKFVFRSMSSVCSANSGGYRKNPDFSKLNKRGFSHSRNKPAEEKDGSDNFEASDISSSKNGSYLSGAGNASFQATATPRPNEKGIVEIFRKVQAKLRDGTPSKEEKNENLQGPRKQRETVDSLLKLLREHSVQRGKRTSSTSSNRDFIQDHPQPNGSFSTEKSSRFLKNKVPETGTTSISRPTSSFRRRSPVPQMKKLPTYADEETINSISLANSDGKQEATDPEFEVEHEPKFDVSGQPDTEPKFMLNPEPEAEMKLVSQDVDILDEISGSETSKTDEGNSGDDANEENMSEHIDLSEMKLTELRTLAKSRGIKGFSKLKKGELMQMLAMV